MSREGKEEVLSGKTGDAVKALFKNISSDYEIISKLRKQYPNDDDFINKVFEAYKDRLEYIKKRAEKFKMKILSEYSLLSIAELVKKAKKFKRKYNLSDDEFAAFIAEISSSKTHYDTSYNAPRGVMANIMGYPDLTGTFGGKLNVKHNELETVQQILKIFAETFGLHRQIILQSLTYQDCAYQALTGKYDSTKYNSFSYIHPIVAAFFLPKIKLLDDTMLIASLSNIIKTKYEDKRIMNLQEFELFRGLITDPNDVMCLTNRDSPIADLKLRVLVQVKLWECVINLRSGRYYGDKFNELISLLESCNTNIFDAADLAYSRDEGSLVRRLLGVFSLRPTYVQVKPVMDIRVGSLHEVSAIPFIQYTTIPMITLRLPPSKDSNAPETDLQESFMQKQYFIENKAIIEKSQSIMWSRNLLIFYVNRRYQHIDFKLLTTPFSFTALPTTFSKFNSVNMAPVAYKQSVSIPECGVFELKSVVFVNKLHSLQNINLITGCSAGIVTDGTGGKPSYVLYNPQDAGVKGINPFDRQFPGDLEKKVLYGDPAPATVEEKQEYIRMKNMKATSYEEIDPVSSIQFSDAIEDSATFMNMYKHFGTVYIYVKNDEMDRPILPNY